MQRRKFLQITGAAIAAFMAPAPVMAQNAQTATPQPASAATPTRPPIETLSEKDVTLISGFSDGRACTYMNQK